MLRFCSLLILAVFLFFSCVSIGFVDDYDKCGDRQYTAVNQICENDILKDPCGTENNYYNPITQFCSDQDTKIYNKCGGKSYNTSNQICEDNIIKTQCETGNGYHVPETQFCNGDNVFYKCDGKEYEPKMQDCCNDVIFNLATEMCEDNIIKIRCGSESYNPAIEICSNGIIKAKEEFVDNRDGKTYKYVTIGTKTWMAENLKHESYNTKCYDNKPDNCETYGILYDWETALTICPYSWHLPNDSEWNTLRDFVGTSDAGTKLKANSDLWISGKGTDEFGFTALPGGFYRSSFKEIREVSGFWSATAGSASGSAHFRYFKYNESSLNRDGFYIDDDLANVRCIKD